MTTLRITVDNRKNAQLLTKMLKSIVFVKDVEEDITVNKSADQYKMLSQVLKTIKPNSVLNSIDNPVIWQKEIRDEWETR
jgi:hypothetical protein